MIEVQVQVTRLTPTATAPTMARGAGSVFDLYADEATLLVPGTRVEVRTGVALHFPNGTRGEIRPRADLAEKNGITILDAPKTIEPAENKEIRVLLINLGSAPHLVEAGSAVAEIVVLGPAQSKLVERVGASALKGS